MILGVQLQEEEAREWAKREAYIRGWESMEVSLESLVGGKTALFLNQQDPAEVSEEDVEKFEQEVKERFPSILVMWDYPSSDTTVIDPWWW